MSKIRSQVREFLGLAVWITVIIGATAVLKSWMISDGTQAEKPSAAAPERLD